MSVEVMSVYEELLEITHALGADADEDFLEAKAAGFAGSEDEFVEFIRCEAPKWYVSIAEPPCWLQNPEWPYHNAEPMVFVGQLARNADETGLHDEAAFFVFWDRVSGVTETVIQMA